MFDKTRTSGERIHSTERGQAGFDGLLSALRDSLLGQVDPQQVDLYREALYERLDRSRAEVDNMVIPEAARKSVAPVLEQTKVCFERMEDILELVGDYLYEDSGEALSEAMTLFEVVKRQLSRTA